MDIEREVSALVKELKRDKEFYFTWQSNIAMAFFDEAKRNKIEVSTEILHKISNDAAKNFLTLLCK